MKSLKVLLILFIAFSFSVAITSCGGKHTHKENIEKAENQGPEYTSAYVCPMHCEGSGSDAPGTCPVCGMDYVANKDIKGEDHEGHDHDEHEGHDH